MERVGGSADGRIGGNPQTGVLCECRRVIPPPTVGPLPAIICGIYVICDFNFEFGLKVNTRLNMVSKRTHKFIGLSAT